MIEKKQVAKEVDLTVCRQVLKDGTEIRAWSLRRRVPE